MDSNNVDFKSMMSNLMNNSQDGQKKMADLINEMNRNNENKTVSAQAGGGMVEVTANLKFHVTDIKLSDDLFKEKPEVISELISGAVNQALEKVQQMAKEQMLNVAKMGMSQPQG